MEAIQFDGIFSFQNQSDYLVNVLKASSYRKRYVYMGFGRKRFVSFQYGE